MDLVPAVGSTQRYDWDETSWTLESGYSRRRGDALSRRRDRLRDQAQHPQAPQRLRLRGDGGSGDGERRGHPGAQARRGRALQRPRRPGGHRRIRRADDPGAAGDEDAPVRHLPRPSAPGARGRRAHRQDAAGPSRREPSGQGLHHRQGRDRVDEPRLRGRSREPARQRRGDACVAVRRLELRHCACRPSGLLGAISPRGFARAARQPLSLPPLRRPDRRLEGAKRRERPKAPGARGSR